MLYEVHNNMMLPIPESLLCYDDDDDDDIMSVVPSSVKAPSTGPFSTNGSSVGSAQSSVGSYSKK